MRAHHPADQGRPRASLPGPEHGAGSDTALLERPREDLSTARPWNVVVWNDPVNLMSYVSYVFRSHFGYSSARARALMLEVHERGRSVVFTGGREVAEGHVGALHGYGLWATLEQDED
ncbi:ATP-dependent Clp protease adapter ClpS [Micrococcus sp.]|uniref:ATP-dependent Clp protease adapter ClpS n=1 Tax=Micrococcus sp. TaxID=1271 RepID=UPI002A9164F7|nr:ATP-dependent Clp protease adapter ClpS [Micrococcus sp.]MDY6055705.1 ATP-dependent Clp protease adapter ClpS [Micrococcus sp.]